MRLWGVWGKVTPCLIISISFAIVGGFGGGQGTILVYANLCQ